MVFKTRHFTTLAVILGIILGLSAWSLPSYAQMRHGRGEWPVGQTSFF